MPPKKLAAREPSSSPPTQVTRSVYSARLPRHEDWPLRLPSAGLPRSEQFPDVSPGCAVERSPTSLMIPELCSRPTRRSMTWRLSRREYSTQFRVRRTEPDTVVPMTYNRSRVADVPKACPGAKRRAKGARAPAAATRCYAMPHPSASSDCDRREPVAKPDAIRIYRREGTPNSSRRRPPQSSRPCPTTQSHGAIWDVPDPRDTPTFRRARHASPRRRAGRRPWQKPDRPVRPGSLQWIATGIEPLLPSHLAK
jgi:hypothetical protein